MAQIKNVAQGAWVTVIDSRETVKPKLRVAAYVRVSSDSEDQINSYLAQVDFYTKYIASREEWELADIYADEGLTGMEVRHREEFNRMIADCREGKIDRILVKSISRFARNQEDYILYMRELLSMGVTISFEKENIDTGKMTSEQIADIYGAFAQMETTGHSQNMRVSYRMKMERGEFVPAKAPYGYRLAEQELHIVPEEAAVVRRIFNEFLAGRGKMAIAKELNAEGKANRQTGAKWSPATIDYILTNITYTGDQIWHKTYMTDVLPFKKLKNRGQKPKYFAEDCCPAIIDKETFERVQALIAARNETYHPGGKIDSVFRDRVYCGKCGSLCKRKKCSGGIYWICRKHDYGESRCPASRIAETELSEVIRRFYGKMYYGRDTVIKPMLDQLKEIREKELRGNNRISDIDMELARLSEQNLVLNRLKDKGYVDPALYISQRDEIAGKVQELRRLRRTLMERTQGDETIRKTEIMLDHLENGPEWLEEIEPEVFSMLIDRLILTEDRQVRIRLINGMEVTEIIEGR